MRSLFDVIRITAINSEILEDVEYCDDCGDELAGRGAIITCLDCQERYEEEEAQDDEE
jgi:hypothetical protein